MKEGDLKHAIKYSVGLTVNGEYRSPEEYLVDNIDNQNVKDEFFEGFGVLDEHHKTCVLLKILEQYDNLTRNAKYQRPEDAFKTQQKISSLENFYKEIITNQKHKQVMGTDSSLGQLLDEGNLTHFSNVIHDKKKALGQKAPKGNLEDIDHGLLLSSCDLPLLSKMLEAGRNLDYKQKGKGDGGFIDFLNAVANWVKDRIYGTGVSDKLVNQAIDDLISAQQNQNRSQNPQPHLIFGGDRIRQKLAIFGSHTEALMHERQNIGLNGGNKVRG